MMPSWTDLALLQWRHPWALLVLVLPLALTWLAHRRTQRLAHYADAHLQPWAVVQTNSGVAGNARKALELTAWLLLALAAAGPHLPLARSDALTSPATPPHQMDVMVVLDVSASMAASDVAPDRLSRARLELSDLLKRANGERLGLSLFAGQAGVLLPLTRDMALFERALSQADADLSDAPHSNVAQALQLANQHLRATASASRAILLVTDADHTSLEGAAGIAAQHAVNTLHADHTALFVLVVASAEGANVPLATGGQAMKDGTAIISQPDLRTWRQWAQNTAGALALVSNGDADWQTLYDRGLAKLPGAAVSPTQAQAWQELYPWPLGLALLLLLWVHLPPAHRRAPASTALLVTLLLGGVATSPPAHARDKPVAQAAAQAYQSQQWVQAQTLFARQGGYAGHMGAGAAAWKLRNAAAAARHFKQALLLAHDANERDDALYNLGLALAGQDQWAPAVQAWRAVLLSRPNDAAASANLAYGTAHLAKRAAATPMKSDLRGRAGFLAEGQVSTDAAGTPQDEPTSLPPLSQNPQAKDQPQTQGAQLNAQATASQTPPAALDPQRLQSGLVKMAQLQEQQRTLLRGMLKQDRQAAPSADSAGVPW